MKASFITAREAADLFTSGMTVCPIGMTLVSSCEAILKEIEKKFLSEGTPKDLIYVHSCGQSDRKDGNNHLAHKGLVKRVIGSHWGLSPKWMDLIRENSVEAYCIPQGQMTHLYRAMAGGKPGSFSKIGLGTFIDPRVEGGKMNERTKVLEDISEIISLRGEEYLFYHSMPLDIVLIRGTYADEMGNLSTQEEAMKLEMLPAVMAARHYGGKVIAQVKKVVATGTLNPKDVVVPGPFIDHIVVTENPLEDHRQTSSWYFDPAYSGSARDPITSNKPLPLDIRKIIGKRGALEMYNGCIINLGTGIPNDVIGGIIGEEQIGDQVVVTVESGIYGGEPAGTIDFGIGKNLWAMIEHDKQFDYYNGVGVDITFMGVGEVDKNCNVNSTKMGDKCPGAGGFIDITTPAKHVVFLSTFTAGGLSIEIENGNLKILKEGKIKKFVEEVTQISYNGQMARKRNQKMHIITERAVFEMRPEGLVLTEIAEGIDLKKDILDQMGFIPIISENLMFIPKEVYLDNPLELRAKLNIKENNVI